MALCTGVGWPMRGFCFVLFFFFFEQVLAWLLSRCYCFDYSWVMSTKLTLLFLQSSKCVCVCVSVCFFVFFCHTEAFVWPSADGFFTAIVIAECVRACVYFAMYF